MFLEQRGLSRFNAGAKTHAYVKVLIALTYVYLTVIDKGVLTQPIANCPKYVDEGEDLNCTCSAPRLNMEGADISWPRYSTTPRLQIKRVSRRDNGRQYTCQMVWNKITSTTVYTLRVAYGPSDDTMLIDGPPVFTTNGSQTLVLPCLAKEVNPKPIITWLFEPCGGAQTDNCTFKPDPLRDDGAVIKCRAMNSYSATPAVGTASYVLQLKSCDRDNDTAVTVRTTTKATSEGGHSSSLFRRPEEIVIVTVVPICAVLIIIIGVLIFAWKCGLFDAFKRRRTQRAQRNETDGENEEDLLPTPRPATEGPQDIVTVRETDEESTSPLMLPVQHDDFPTPSGSTEPSSSVIAVARPAGTLSLDHPLPLSVQRSLMIYGVAQQLRDLIGQSETVSGVPMGILTRHIRELHPRPQSVVLPIDDRSSIIQYEPTYEWPEPIEHKSHGFGEDAGFTQVQELEKYCHSPLTDECMQTGSMVLASVPRFCQNAVQHEFGRKKNENQKGSSTEPCDTPGLSKTIKFFKFHQDISVDVFQWAESARTSSSQKREQQVVAGSVSGGSEIQEGDTETHVLFFLIYILALAHSVRAGAQFQVSSYTVGVCHYRDFRGRSTQFLFRIGVNMPHCAISDSSAHKGNTQRLSHKIVCIQPGRPTTGDNMIASSDVPYRTKKCCSRQISFSIALAEPKRAKSF
ncbi:hypothetical protein BaRGS_00029701 [Batillaria attramentaria]|uniref:Ig-like domain-containing protein n=1 Tax=Batillaria attramentaria TaxID=370345 RepID=A0ABD0JVA7_9CAEN